MPAEMDDIEIQLELMVRQNTTDEYDRRSIRVNPLERLLPFRDRVAQLFNLQANSIKLITRGKLVDLNPMYNLTDVGIDQHFPVHVLSKSIRAPSMTRRRPQSAQQPFIPHPDASIPNAYPMGNGRTLVELSVNRYVMHVVYQGTICPQAQLDSIVRTIAESFRLPYNVDVDVQRRSRRPQEGDISFDVSFRAPPVMPSGAYNRFEAIKSMLIRQKMLITFTEKYLCPHFETPETAAAFSDEFLNVVDKIESFDIISRDDFFPDQDDSLKMQDFIERFRSEVAEDLPLLGNVLQVRHLIPVDYYNLMKIVNDVDAEIHKLTLLQQNLFTSDRIVDTKVSDLYLIILRRLRHFHSHISHLLSEISLRQNDSLRVAYPQNVLTTFSGLNPDITCTIVFMEANRRPDAANNEISTSRFTTFHQVHMALPLIRASVHMEVELATASSDEENPGAPQAQPQPHPHHHHHHHQVPHFHPHHFPNHGMLRSTMIRGAPAGIRMSDGRISNGTARMNISQLIRGTRTRPGPMAVRTPRQFMTPRTQPVTTRPPGTPTPAPVGSSSATSSPIGNNSNRPLREILQSLSDPQVQTGEQNSQRFSMSPQGLVTPLNTIFRSVESNGFQTPNAAGGPMHPAENEVTIEISTISQGDNNNPAQPTQPVDLRQYMNAAGQGHQNNRQQALIQESLRQMSNQNRQQVVIQQQPGARGSIPIPVQRLRTPYSMTTPRQARNLGPSGGCPIAYFERITSDNLESHALAQEVSTNISDADLVPAIQRYPMDANVLRRNVNEFAVTSVEGLEVLLRSYLQGLVSYNTGRQVAHPAVMNEVVHNGHRIQYRRPSYRDRTLEFYRLMGSQEIEYLRTLLRQTSFLEDRGFLGIIASTMVFSINFEQICHLLQNPHDLGTLREAMKAFVFQRFSTLDVESILIDCKVILSENYYHYLMGVGPFAIQRNNRNMVGTLQRIDADMLSKFYSLLLGEDSDSAFSTGFMDLLRTYHSLLISFCYEASNGFSHAYREFLRNLFLDFPAFEDVHKDFAMDVFMESLVSLALSFDNPDELRSINTSNISDYFLPASVRFSPEPGSMESPLGVIGQIYPTTQAVDIDTTVSSPGVSSTTHQLIDEDLE